jgi:hypothetical protein
MRRIDCDNAVLDESDDTRIVDHEVSSGDAAQPYDRGSEAR